MPATEHVKRREGERADVGRKVTGQIVQGLMGRPWTFTRSEMGALGGSERRSGRT